MIIALLKKGKILILEKEGIFYVYYQVVVVV